MEIKKTKTKPRKKPGKNGFKYREQYGVVVTCNDERHQAAVYESLRGQGLVCKVVVV